jgi:hypothetical protein
VRNHRRNAPQCSSTYREFEEISDKKKLRFDGKKFDILLINGSNHRANNTGYMVDLIEEVLGKRVSVTGALTSMNLPSLTAGAATVCGIMPAGTRAGTSWMICPLSMR